MRLIRLPGVFRPRSDTWMLARELVDSLPAGGRASVLELCTGSGAVALSAAAAGADVTAVDVSRRSVAAVRLNALLRGLRVRALRGSLFEPVGAQRFDLIATNPPYVPAETDTLPARGPQRAWDAGRDGRALIDPICDAATEHLRPGGALLMIHSSLCGEAETVARLTAAGLEVDVPVRSRGPLGPLMLSRVAQLEASGALKPGEREEELVIVRGRKPI
ncbi:MAG: release factor glutamine methyltransferase [Thermoleophilaceae bacterium]|nr:release factor glutamine methyltransferase [Thermoleophilaceae bacterium]MEA2470241.1 release factor glutamine methyltransferase [Thermoleophilaceae bacterium]